MYFNSKQIVYMLQAQNRNKKSKIKIKNKKSFNLFLVTR
jgi:hypothetical protein